MSLFTINAELAPLVEAVRDLASAVREAAGIRQPPRASKPTATVEYYSDEEAERQRIGELVESLRGSPRAMQAAVMRELGFSKDE